MNIFNFLRPYGKPRTTASVAKERLQIIVSHESRKASGRDFIKQLQNELLEVISKYVDIDSEEIRVQLEHNKDNDVLELSVSLPENLAELTPKDTATTTKDKELDVAEA